MGRISRALRVVEDAALALLIGLITAMIFAGVVARYVFSAPLQWSDEIALGLFVWLTFVGAAAAWRNHDMFGIDMIVDRLPRHLRRAVWLFNYVVIALVCIAGMRFGAELVGSNIGSVTMNLEISRSFIDVAFPIGSALMLWHTIEHTVRLLHGEVPVDDRYADVVDASLAASGPTL